MYLLGTTSRINWVDNILKIFFTAGRFARPGFRISILVNLLEPFSLFSPKQAQDLISQVSAADLVPGLIHSRGVVDHVRNNRVFWLSLDSDLKDYLWNVALAHRSCIPWTWFQEPVQISCYGPGQHYDWHTDVLIRGRSRRCLTLTSTLNATDTVFETRHRSYTLGPGEAVFFPSDLEHRACAPSQGYRWALTVWYMQPNS